ncbi:M20/M25/M40 family metallo-hydrolase [Alteromonas sp. ASW11-130]|uniref:M20/M25/M40 family metallo-hydrolase n=1 Tax=Alteromonas sp. ASW11-130 TaxID=3015775 RepID=UPI0022418E5A|nr:M20/M25/M40 family metallo-hydrolase [Alteromonas sp. ASW11-130]MCW8091047.1 M20/M25/M40 family metallo-hydrolase [Alteromonas sp. ASW11-130]
MKRFSWAIFLAGIMGSLFFSGAVHALDEKLHAQLDELKNATVHSTLSYDIIESLTTEVGARMVGTPAEKKSVEWAMVKMKELGFDKVWKEESQAPDWQRGELEVALTSPFHHKLVALSLGNSVGTSAGAIEAQVEMFESLEALSAAKQNSLAGKIAYVAFAMERRKDGSGYSEAVGARVNGASIAAKRGAVAFAMRSVGTDSHRFAHTGVMRYSEGNNHIPAIALSNPDADLLENALLRTQPVTMSISSTASGKLNNNVTIANVIGEITGSENPEEIVTLGAHLDSWDVGTGAIDDGIGVGITLAAVNHITKMKQRPKRTIRVILFAAEEIGLLGAKDYVEKHKDNMMNHVIGAEWDFGNGKIYKLAPGVGDTSLSKLKEFAGYLSPMGVEMASTNNAKGQSDMSLLGKAGQPAVNFYPDGNDYFDYHHTENDTLDKVNQEALKTNTAIYTMFAWYAANSGVDFRK